MRAVRTLQRAAMEAVLTGASAAPAPLPRNVIPGPGPAEGMSVLGAVVRAPVSKGGIRALAARGGWRHGHAQAAVMPPIPVIRRVPTFGGLANRWISTVSGS